MKTVKLSEVNKDVKVVDGKLFFGEKEVQYCEFIKEDSIAKLYVIRVPRSIGGSSVPYWGFVTGLDLIDGKFWLGPSPIKIWENGMQKNWPSAYYSDWSTVERILNEFNTDTAGNEWQVFEEEDFEAMQDEDQG